MTSDALKELLEKEDITIIDVREMDEFKSSGKQFTYEKKDEQGNVLATMTAKNIPMGKVYTEAYKGRLSKGTHIVAVCDNGDRSRDVATSLKNNKGFWTDYLEGGLENWSG